MFPPSANPAPQTEPFYREESEYIMSTTEEFIEATVNADGTATVSIQGSIHEFTAANEAAARAQTVELVSAHATQRGTALRPSTQRA